MHPISDHNRQNRLLSRQWRIFTGILACTIACLMVVPLTMALTTWLFIGPAPLAALAADYRDIGVPMTLLSNLVVTPFLLVSRREHMFEWVLAYMVGGALCITIGINFVYFTMENRYVHQVFDILFETQPSAPTISFVSLALCLPATLLAAIASHALHHWRAVSRSI